MANDYTADAINNFTNLMAGAIQAQATRPQKESVYTNTTTTNTPYALADMIANRDRIGQATSALDEVLKRRDADLGYSWAKALSNIPQQQGYGTWLGDFARALGGGMATPTDLEVETAKQKYQNEMNDLATILAYDKAMGDTQTQIQNQTIGYKEMPYGTGKGDGNGQIEEIENYDVSTPEYPAQPIEWSDIDIQGQKTDPQTGLPTLSGLGAKYIGAAIEPQARFAKNANQNAYTKTFTIPTITKISKAAGGSRGIDTMPEVNIKGGPELSSANMNSTEFKNAVKDQAWDIADQILKANPNATITRAELANAFINNFNHRIRPDFRIVKGFNISKPQDTIQQPISSQPNTKELLKIYGLTE